MPFGHLTARSRPWELVGLVLSGAAAAGAGLEPTGLPLWDSVLSGLFVLGIAVLFSIGPRWLLMFGLTLAVVLSADVVVAGFGTMALALLLMSELDRVRSSAVDVVAAVSLATGLTHLRPFAFFGSCSLIVGGLVSLAGLLWWGRTARAHRRRAVRSLGALLLVAVVLALSGAVGAFLARGEAELGARAAREGLEAARDGDVAAASAALSRSERSLDRADRWIAPWWARGARVVPVLGHQIKALQTAIDGASQVVRATNDALVDVDLDRLRARNGTLDLAQVRLMSGPLARVETAMLDARAAIEAARSPWLVGGVDSRLEDFHSELNLALPDATKAADVTRLLPDLLGDDRPRRYLALFGTPAESRELGGIVGNVVELTVDGGRVMISDQKRDDELNAAGPGLLADPSVYPARFLINHPELFTQNWSGMTDFPSVARAVAELYPTMGGRPIDGVLYVDPFAIGALLSFTGPIDVPLLGRSLDAETVTPFLLHEQYAVLELDQRIDFLEEIAVATFARLLEVDLPAPRLVGDVLGPSARGGHLQMATFDVDENALLEQLFLLGRLRPPDPGADHLGVVHVNGGGDKLDAFLERTVDYRATVDPDTGELRGVVTVTLTNTVVPGGLPTYVVGGPSRRVPPGTNRVHLSIYTPHELQALSIDGSDVEAELQEEFGYGRYLTFVEVAPGATASVSFELAGRLDLSGGVYRLHLSNQALANDEQVSVDVRLGQRRLTEAFTLVEEMWFELSTD